VVHIGGWNGKNGGSHRNDNVESRDENNTTRMNLPNSNIRLLIQSTSLQGYGPPTTPRAMVVRRQVQYSWVGRGRGCM
jgi:hypothetical protein